MFIHLANTMKKELIELDAKLHEDEKQVTKDSFELQCQVLGLLLNHKITTFHFPLELMINENEAAATELCHRLVAERPPGLHTLVGLSPYNYREDSWDFRPLVNNLVDVFPNIEVLQIDGCTWNDDDLRKVADHLPNLRYAWLWLM